MPVNLREALAAKVREIPCESHPKKTYQDGLREMRAHVLPLITESPELAHLEARNAKLREALAELLRVDDAWHGAVNSEMAQARAGARAALAGDVNVSESQPIDEAWLRSVGFMRNDVDPFIWINDGYNDWECDLEWWPDEQRFWLESDGMMIQLPDKYQSRRAVRRLCEALGVELKSEEPK